MFIIALASLTAHDDAGTEHDEPSLTVCPMCGGNPAFRDCPSCGGGGYVPRDEDLAGKTADSEAEGGGAPGRGSVGDTTNDPSAKENHCAETFLHPAHVWQAAGTDMYCPGLTMKEARAMSVTGHGGSSRGATEGAVSPVQVDDGPSVPAPADKSWLTDALDNGPAIEAAYQAGWKECEEHLRSGDLYEAVTRLEGYHNAAHGQRTDDCCESGGFIARMKAQLSGVSSATGEPTESTLTDDFKAEWFEKGWKAGAADMLGQMQHTIDRSMATVDRVKAQWVDDKAETLGDAQR